MSIEYLALSLWLLIAILVAVYCAFQSHRHGNRIDVAICMQFGLLWPALVVFFLLARRNR